jgi:23S rRNA (uracil1939-C5)-methyltransferase
VNVDITALAVGGDGIGRAADGRVVFVSGALPGETVHVRVVDERKSLLRAEVAEVVVASPDRQEPWCPHQAEGCGGCGWQHVRPERQSTHKRAIVLDALRRTGGLSAEDAERIVRLGPELPDRGLRTTMRAAIDGEGRVGMRAYRSDHVVPIVSCGVAHPALDAALWSSEVAPGALELEMRVGVASGERTSRLVFPGDDLINGPLPPGVVHETVSGVSLRVSAGSFFQTSAVGAESLVGIVDEAVGPAETGQPLIDLYGGVGLFAATVGRRFDEVTVVEISRSSCRDARTNLAARAGAEIVERDVAKWRPARRGGPRPIVIADPARRGLDRGGVETIAACRPARIVLVSCDVGSYGRDTKLLREAGFELTDAVCVDLFPNTPLVEVVSTFVPHEPR